VVRILKGSHQPKDNVTGAERRDLRSLETNGMLTVLPADKGNVAVVMGTLDYNQKIATLLDGKAYKTLNEDPHCFCRTQDYSSPEEVHVF
jgi:hypothetical protein